MLTNLDISNLKNIQKDAPGLYKKNSNQALNIVNDEFKLFDLNHNRL